MNDGPRGAVELRSKSLTTMSDAEIDTSWRLADAFAKSGLFPDAKDAARAFAKMVVGADLGLSPTHALTGIHMVEGKPQIASTTLAGFVRQSQLYEYDVTELTDERCSITFRSIAMGDDERPPDVSEFTIADAKRAELGGWPDEAKFKRSNWGKFPKNMLFARAMSNGVRWYAPDLFGGVPVYTEADEFSVRSTLTSPAEQGILGEPLELPREVEEVIARATAVGHVGLSDRATVEMTLKDQSNDFIDSWVRSSEFELDRVEAERAAQSERPPDPTGGEGGHAR